MSASLFMILVLLTMKLIIAVRNIQATVTNNSEFIFLTKNLGQIAKNKIITHYISATNAYIEKYLQEHYHL